MSKSRKNSGVTSHSFDLKIWRKKEGRKGTRELPPLSLSIALALLYRRLLKEGNAAPVVGRPPIIYQERARVGEGDLDITEIYITESAITNFQEIDITESDITEKGNCYNGICYNGI